MKKACQTGRLEWVLKAEIQGFKFAAQENG